MAVINIDDAYILNETGAQVDKVTGLFTKDEDTTSGEKAFAQLNIGTAGSNRNLLDNPWFTVNQRGATGASSNTYGLDRWLGVGTGYTVNSDGTVTITGAMVQRNDWASIWGKTVTISAMVVSGEIYSWSGPMTTGPKSIGGLLNAVVVSSSQINFSAVSNLKALKLELGSVSTIANDAPPDYGEELRKCMRYFVRWWADPVGTAYISSSLNVAYMHINTGVQMRAVPTVSINGAIQIRVQGGTIGVSSIEAYAAKLPTVGVTITCNMSSSASVVSPASAYFNSTAHYIDLSADL